MAYQSVWWYPNYVEYGAGLNPGKTWPQVMEQYRKPHSLYDLRYYDLPTEEYAAKLYYRLPRLGQPKYRGLFRDKPHLLPNYFPGEYPQGKPLGFHGKVYYEDGPPQFKYEGRKLDKTYWLERPPYTPSFPDHKQTPVQGRDSLRGLNEPRPPSGPPSLARRSTDRYSNYGSTRDPVTTNPSKRVTQDGVGYM